MIQINLLPDVKLEFVKARRLKRTIVTICTLVSIVAIAIFALCFISVTVVQKQHLDNLDGDIKSQTKELQNVPDIAKILTIQNQLNSLPGLHKDKPVASRIFTYIQQLAPKEASISSLTVDFGQQTMTVTGTADNLASVNKFADTLKFTSYTVEGDQQGGGNSAFSEVTLSQFSIGSGTLGGKAASYTINLKYTPEIFSSATKTKLLIPNQVTTRSETERPQNIFEAPTTTSGEGDQ